MNAHDLDAAVALLFEQSPSKSAEMYEVSSGDQWTAVHVGAGVMEWHPKHRYSSSLDSAMRAYEEFRNQRGWSRLMIEEEENGRWCANIARSELWLHSFADTPAMALCLVIVEAAGLTASRAEGSDK